MTSTKWIGQSVERLEDPPLVQGRGRFAGDISFAHQLHMRMVRSNHAHGRIVSIDTAAARALPGVVAVWTAADIADIPPIDFREGRIEKLEPYRQPVLATGVLEREPDISDEDLLDALSSNLCRCTGYETIVKAVRAAERVFPRAQHRAGYHPPGLWRRRRGSAHRAHRGGA